MILILAAIFFISFKNSVKGTLNDSNFEENNIYIIVRGTDTKSGWIAKEYNQNNKDATHIGIGFMDYKDFKVFHISDELSLRGDNLFQESLFNFIERDDLIYFSIWKINKIDISTFNRIKRSLYISTEKVQYFDKEILIDNGSFYCSEFVNEILSINGINTFDKISIKLKGVPKSFLGRDTLEYYPVDGFMKSKNVVKVFEWRKDMNIIEWKYIMQD